MSETKFDPRSPIQPKRRYTPEETAKILLISKGALANLRCENKGPNFFKAAGRVQYLGEDILEYLEDRKVITKGAA